ncbi:SapC family protein [Vibrio taketomensis]|uniref:SapC family protein n=1 Tax=Vibrio taketomensis TaxID=2572923 RepID=UPI0022B293E9|nr:SapC family protein [Vibrio taketomensis]
MCLDESYAGCNQEDRGERLFDGDGEQTQYLQKVVDFLQDYQSHYQRTQAFCRKLAELDLFEDMGPNLRCLVVKSAPLQALKWSTNKAEIY